MNIALFSDLAHIIIALCALMTILSAVAVFAGALQCALRRLDGVSFMAGLAYTNIIYHPELFNASAAGPRRFYMLGQAGLFLFPLLAIVVGSIWKRFGR